MIPTSPTSLTIPALHSQTSYVFSPFENSSLPAARVPLPATTKVWGVDFAQLGMEQTLQLAMQIVELRIPEYFVTANLNYLMLTQQHPRLVEVNQHSAAVIADGMPIVLRSRWKRDPLPARVAGADLIVELARMSAERGYRIFFLGAAEGVAQAAANALQVKFPALQIAGCYAPPFRELSANEHQAMVARIQQAKTDILLVAFGQPKGECWIYDHLRELAVPLSIQLGASFDFLAGSAHRAPLRWQKLGCEWLYRAATDPKRLGPRYARNVAFLLQCIAMDFLASYTPAKKTWL